MSSPMDYHTLFVTSLVSRILAVIVLSGLAFANRTLLGLRWFSLALLLWVVRTAIEMLRGQAPLAVTIPLCTYGANAIASFVYLAMFLGFRWFLLRTGPRGRLVPALVLVSMTLYPSEIFFGLWTRYPVGTLPALIAGFASVHLLLTRARQPFVVVARVTAFFFALFLVFTGYRTVVLTHNIAARGLRVGAWPDPQILVTMLVLMILDFCFVASFIWFYVVETQFALRQQTRTDGLTGALNGRALEVEAEREMARCRRNGGALSLIVLDIDYFKQLNDARGHDAGDVALRSLVCLLHEELRLHDLVARTGGEEFLILLPETSLAAARVLAARIRLRIEQSSFGYDDGLPICITASLGLAELAAGGNDTWLALRRRGDAAMYAAKRLGRNRVVEQTEASPVLLFDPGER
ncbi:GGDEF domain-containing protein [Granulicella pectinivorans]|uniref:GGDEF domain-containing protein n=1 Tax=Granulicella pectinivorans TaxID=474950 RepID=UPI001587408A|nr:GGDEF domain-containing protein [Granulicella pectinivorans]